MRTPTHACAAQSGELLQFLSNNMFYSGTVLVAFFQRWCELDMSHCRVIQLTIVGRSRVCLLERAHILDHIVNLHLVSLVLASVFSTAVKRDMTMGIH